MDNELLNQIGEIIGIADIVSLTTAANPNSPNAKNGSITVNLGVAETGEVQSQNVQFYSLPGIMSTPVLPAKTANNSDATEALYFNRNGSNIVFATRHIGSQMLAGKLGVGELFLFAAGKDGKSQNNIKLTNDGAINISATKGNSVGGGGMSIALTPDDTVAITNSAKSALNLSPDSALLSTTGGSLTIQKAGTVQIVANTDISMTANSNVNVGGTSIMLGGSGAQAVLTVADLPAIFALISAAFATLTPGGVIVTGGQPAAAAIASGQAAVISAASAKITKGM